MYRKLEKVVYSPGDSYGNYCTVTYFWYYTKEKPDPEWSALKKHIQLQNGKLDEPDLPGCPMQQYTKLIQIPSYEYDKYLAKQL